jgi:hypothetical protein
MSNINLKTFEITLRRISLTTNMATRGISAYSEGSNVAVVPARQSDTSSSATMRAGCSNVLHRLQAIRLIQCITNILFNFLLQPTILVLV